MPMRLVSMGTAIAILAAGCGVMDVLPGPYREGPCTLELVVEDRVLTEPYRVTLTDGQGTMVLYRAKGWSGTVELLIVPPSGQQFESRGTTVAATLNADVVAERLDQPGLWVIGAKDTKCEQRLPVQVAL